MKLDMVLCELDSGAVRVCEILRERCLNEDVSFVFIVVFIAFLII